LRLRRGIQLFIQSAGSLRARTTDCVDAGTFKRVIRSVNSGLPLKGKLGELQFYFKKILLHQQKFLVVSVLSNSLWLPRNLKKCPKWNY